MRPSVGSILESLADALRLDGSERRYLHALGSEKVSVGVAAHGRPTNAPWHWFGDLVEEYEKLPVFVGGRAR